MAAQLGIGGRGLGRGALLADDQLALADADRACAPSGGGRRAARMHRHGRGAAARRRDRTRSSARPAPWRGSAPPRGCARRSRSTRPVIAMRLTLPMPHGQPVTAQNRGDLLEHCGQGAAGGGRRRHLGPPRAGRTCAAPSGWYGSSATRSSPGSPAASAAAPRTLSSSSLHPPAGPASAARSGGPRPTAPAGSRGSTRCCSRRCTPVRAVVDQLEVVEEQVDERPATSIERSQGRVAAGLERGVQATGAAASRSRASRKSGWCSGSPPDNGHPAPRLQVERRGRARPRPAPRPRVMRRGRRSRAPRWDRRRRSSPQRTQRSRSVARRLLLPGDRPVPARVHAGAAAQAAARPQHRLRLAARPSGLWHHAQRSGQPFRKTVVRMPGPSWMAKRRMSKTMPVTRHHLEQMRGNCSPLSMSTMRQCRRRGCAW